MAGNMSNYLENKVLEHSLGVASFTMPSAVYVGLFTTDPTDIGSGNEVSGAGYTRKQATFGVASGSISNNSDILFDTAQVNYGTISHIAIFDSLTAGNLLWHGQLTASKIVMQNDQFKIASGQITDSFD